MERNPVSIEIYMHNVWQNLYFSIENCGEVNAHDEEKLVETSFEFVYGGILCTEAILTAHRFTELTMILKKILVD